MAVAAAVVVVVDADLSSAQDEGPQKIYARQDMNKCTEALHVTVLTGEEASICHHA